MVDNNDLSILHDKIDKYLENEEYQWLRCPGCGHKLRKECILIGKIEIKCKNCDKKQNVHTHFYNDLETVLRIIFEENEKKT